MDATARGHALHAYLYARFDSMIAQMMLGLADHFYVEPRTAALWGRRARDMQIGSPQYRRYHERLRGKATTRSRAYALALASVGSMVKTGYRTLADQEQMMYDRAVYGFSVSDHGRRVDPRSISAVG
jgi:hypothetical protein